MALASSIATRNAARNATIDAEIIKFDDVEFSREGARRWKHFIVTEHKNVPTKILGVPESHSHSFLAKTNPNFNKRSSKNPTPAAGSGALKYITSVVADTQTITMAHAYKNYKVALKTFHI